MKDSNRSAQQLQLVEDYCKANMLWRENEDLIEYTDVVELDISSVQPTVAGPKRPQTKFFKRFERKVHRIGTYHIWKNLY